MNDTQCECACVNASRNARGMTDASQNAAGCPLIPVIHTHHKFLRMLSCPCLIPVPACPSPQTPVLNVNREQLRQSPNPSVMLPFSPAPVLARQSHQPLPSLLFLSFESLFQGKLPCVVLFRRTQRLTFFFVQLECPGFHVR